MDALAVQTRQDLDPLFWLGVARVKAEVQQASLADFFAIGLARRVAGTVVTSDRAEFGPVAARGICKVVFFR